jgi:hypothetical protein
MARWEPTFEENEFVQFDSLWAPAQAGRLLLVLRIKHYRVGFQRRVRVVARFADTGETVNVLGGLLIGPEHARWIDDSPAVLAASVAPQPPAQPEAWRGHPLDLDAMFGKDNGPPPF